jgi:hypothetical protein
MFSYTVYYNLAYALKSRQMFYKNKKASSDDTHNTHLASGRLFFYKNNLLLSRTLIPRISNSSTK